MLLLHEVRYEPILFIEDQDEAHVVLQDMLGLSQQAVVMSGYLFDQL